MHYFTFCKSRNDGEFLLLDLRKSCAVALGDFVGFRVQGDNKTDLSIDKPCATNPTKVSKIQTHY